MKQLGNALLTLEILQKEFIGPQGRADENRAGSLNVRHEVFMITDCAFRRWQSVERVLAGDPLRMDRGTSGLDGRVLTSGQPFFMNLAGDEA
jgi:hypothetical protein